MNFYILFTIYLIGAIATGYSWYKVNTAYYSCPEGTKAMTLLTSILWFFGLPAFLWIYRSPIMSTIKGRDWADDHIGDVKSRKAFRDYEKNLKESA